MKRHILTILAVIVGFNVIHAQEPVTDQTEISPFTWGVRAGFAATGTYLTKAIIDERKIIDYTQDTQVGNFAALLVRFNSKSFLLQTGLGLGFNKSSFTLDRNSWNPESNTKSNVSCSYSMVSVMLPLQVGYHIVNQDPYCMSVFTGPRLRYIPDKYYSSDFSGFEPYQITESPNPFAIGWTAGLSVQIGRTFLDFEYEATIGRLTKGMKDTSGADPAPSYTLDRRVGIISFSYGIMF